MAGPIQQHSKLNSSRIMKSIAYFSLLFLVIDLSSCRSECVPSQCLQSIDPFSCPAGTLYQEKVSMGKGGCCPGCVRFRGFDESCNGESAESFDLSTYYTSKTYITTGQQQPIIQSQKCAPGVKCTNGKCSDYKPENNCTKYCDNEIEDIRKNCQKWRPSCDVDGSYAAVQCKTNGPDHRCFCYNKKGERIFGFDWDTPDTRKNMQCMCSRLVDELKKKDSIQGTTFHCSSNGNFEPLQCNEGMCYCADIYTDNPKTMGTKYLKNCDSQTNALFLMIEEMKRHGSKPLLEVPHCDSDGSYLSKQCDARECRCMTGANNAIGPYSAELGTTSELKQNCYCARDQVIFQDAGRSHNYICDGAGNYQQLQLIGNKAFCVDYDGFMTTDDVPRQDRCSLNCADCPPSGK